MSHLNILELKGISNEITMFVSVDGNCWVQVNFRDVSASSNVYYLTESTPIQYFGIYYTVYGGEPTHAPAGTSYDLVDWIRWK